MEKLKRNYPITIQWRSFELRPKNAPPISPEYRERILAARPRFYQMAKEQYDLDINVGPFGIDSRPALIGAKFAEAQGHGDAYHEAVFQAYWQQALSIEEDSVLTGIANQVGLDQTTFTTALTEATYDTAVSDDIMQARQYGITAVPALIFMNKYLVVGAQPYPVLEQVVQKILTEAN